MFVVAGAVVCLCERDSGGQGVKNEVGEIRVALASNVTDGICSKLKWAFQGQAWIK